MSYTQLKKKNTGCMHSIVQCKLKQIAHTRFKKKTPAASWDSSNVMNL